MEVHEEFAQLQLRFVDQMISSHSNTPPDIRLAAIERGVQVGAR